MDAYRAAYNTWQEKTEWVQKDKRFDVLLPWGKHRADVLKEYIEHIEARCAALLASLEAEASGRNPVLAYADSYRDMANQGVESIPVWSVITDLERNIAPLFTAPPAPVSVPAAYENTEDFSECHEGWNACRAAMLQGAEPVSQPYTLRDGRVAVPVEPKPEVAQPPQSESKDGTVTVYPWLVSISFFEKDMRMWTPLSLITHRYDDGLITKEDLHENLREWIKGEIGDNLYTITFFGRMAPYQAPQQETN